MELNETETVHSLRGKTAQRYRTSQINKARVLDTGQSSKTNSNGTSCGLSARSHTGPQTQHRRSQNQRCNYRLSFVRHRMSAMPQVGAF